MPRPPGSRLIRGLSRSINRAWRGPDRREPGPVNHVSLGSHCHTAQIMKRTGLRTWSSAFDWIFSSPGMVADCLADDFSGLLDRAQYESTPLANRPAPKECSCRHRLYAERHAIPYVFNHHDPATSEADYRFLHDGVRRLRAALRAGARNRFYLLTELPTADETVLALSESLARHGPDNRLVFLQCVPRAAAPRAVPLASPRDNLAWLRIETRTPSVGVRFADPDDEAMVEGVVRELALSS